MTPVTASSDSFIGPSFVDLFLLNSSVAISNFHGENAHESVHHGPCRAASGQSLAQTGCAVIATRTIPVRMKQTMHEDALRTVALGKGLVGMNYDSLIGIEMGWILYEEIK